MALLTIETADAKALLKHWDKKDQRKHLHGVRFDKEGYALATDSKTLAVFKNDTAKELSEGITVPFEALALALSQKPTSLEIDTEARVINGVIGFKPLQGDYPDWRRLINCTVAENVKPVLTINATLLGRFGDGVSMVRTSSDTLLITKQNDPSFIGVLMPMREKAEQVLANIATWEGLLGSDGK